MRKLLLLSILFLALIAVLAGGLGGRFLSQHVGGKELWLTWKAERIAKGDRLDWRQLIPPEVPDIDNFAKAPIVAGAITGKEATDPRFKALALPKSEQVWGAWKEGRRIDLGVFRAAYGTQDLLKTLAQHEPALEELTAASRCPCSRIPVDYSEHEIPPILGFRSATRILCLRALVRLSEGNTDGALEDVQTCLRIADHLKAEPCLIVSLLRQAVVTTAMQVIWEGLEDHRWNDRQLQILQRELMAIDLLASVRLGWEGERLMTADAFTRTAEGLPPPAGFKDPEGDRMPMHPGSFGRGWIYRNMLELDGFYVTYAIDVIDPKAHRVHSERYTSPLEWYEQRKYRKDLLMALIAVPALVGQVERQAQLQSFLDQAGIACALERHRLARGEYPARLAELVPTFLPAIPWDISTGTPLHYRRQGGHFRLYSVGWDRKDDAGTMGWTQEQGKRALDAARADWPWPQARP